MKEGLVFCVAASAALIGLAGCGGAANDAKDEAAASVAAETPAAPPVAAAADEPAARAFVDTLFAAYANDGEPDLFSTPAKTFEPELAAALATLSERSEKTGTIEASQEADPVCACQDYGDVSHSIDTLTVDAIKARAVVTFTNFGKAEKRTIDLVSTPEGWRVYDIDGAYRAAVMADVGSK